MIRDTAESFLKEVSTSSAIRNAMESERGFNDNTWQRLCTEMGWQATHIPEEYGGFGLGYVELGDHARANGTVFVFARHSFRRCA